MGIFSLVRVDTESHNACDVSQDRTPVSVSSYMRGHSSRPMVGQTHGSDDLRLFLFAPQFTASAWQAGACLEKNLADYTYLFSSKPTEFRLMQCPCCLLMRNSACASVLRV